MIKYSIICCIYNTLPVARQCLDALLACPQEDAEIILVDNHSPDPTVRQYIRILQTKHDNLSVIDPGKNLGCHQGWNAGYAQSHGAFVFKLDDDTVIRTPGFMPYMAHALNQVPELGYISADIDAKQNNPYERTAINGVDLEIAKTGVVGFSLVCFRRSDVERWGPMLTGTYRAAGGRIIEEDRLYGGEEVYYASAAKSEGKLIAHFPVVFCHHLDNAERDPDYAFWKRAYGYNGWTDLDLTTWRAHGLHLKHYRKAICLELQRKPMNDALLLEWVGRIVQIGGRDDVGLVDAVKAMTSNGAVKEACDNAHKTLEAKP
ncbi:MAG: glycosyltransferase family 2 protein [Planctomycetota bacterium]|nr:glycosyltransferase family 2 protein [Planctomycetota bacterium]